MKIPAAIAAWLGISIIFLGAGFDYSAPVLPQALGTMLAVALAAPACYIAAYRLTSKYLYAKKLRAYVGYMLLLIFINASITFIITLSAYQLMTGIPVFRSAPIMITLATLFFVYDVILITLSCAVRIISDRFGIEQRLIEAQKEKTETELNFLRSQVNPHFLFNVMNTIYFQIDPENLSARESLEKLSEMLRYQLYECTTDRVDIGSEIGYIRNYITIQSLRMEKDTDVRLLIDEKIAGFAIAPMLILPVIENAFKHVSHFKNASENKIHISLRRSAPSFLILDVLNTFDPAKPANGILNSGGLGIPNLQRRLDLLYHRRSEYSHRKRGNIYEAYLKINYHD